MRPSGGEKAGQAAESEINKLTGNSDLGKAAGGLVKGLFGGKKKE